MKTWKQFLIEMGDPYGNVRITPEDIEKRLQDQNLTPKERSDLEFLFNNLRASQQRSGQQQQQRSGQQQQQRSGQQQQQRSGQQQQPPVPQQQMPTGPAHIDQTPTMSPGKFRWQH